MEQKNRYDLNEKNAVTIQIEMDLNVSYLTQVKQVKKDPKDVKIEVVRVEDVKYTFLDLIA